MRVCYHKVSVGYVMFDQASSQDDHPSPFRAHRLAVHLADILNKLHMDNMTNRRRPDDLGRPVLLVVSMMILPSTMSKISPGLLYEWK